MPEKWDNACCFHPRAGETLCNAVERRLLEELGISCTCREVDSFVYCHAFSWSLFSRQGMPNPEEIKDTRWCTKAEIFALLTRDPDHFTPWFITAFPKALRGNESINTSRGPDNTHLCRG